MVKWVLHWPSPQPHALKEDIHCDIHYACYKASMCILLHVTGGIECIMNSGGPSNGASTVAGGRIF